MQNRTDKMALPCITIQQLNDSKLQFALCYQDTLLVTDRVEAIERFRTPCRIDAVTTFVCINGEAECVINLNRYHVGKNMIAICFPDDIIQIESSTHLEAYAVLVSPALLGDLGLDGSRRSDFYLRIRNNAVCQLPREQILSLKPYYALLCGGIQDETDEAVEVIKGLLHAYAYYVIGRVLLCRQSQVDAVADHNKQLFSRFMALVKQYHTMHRGVKFYADKLCLTSNYLSGVVKEYTGKTATEWVNDFVIVEAKIMLKDLNLSVQEIAYRLYFPDQSTFGKYFKRNTGLSPKQYREAK